MYKISVQLDTGMTTLQDIADNYSMQSKFTKLQDSEEMCVRRSKLIQTFCLIKVHYVRLQTNMKYNLHMHKLSLMQLFS